MTNIGQETATKAVAAKLRELLPVVEGLDWDILAEALVESIDIAAIDMVNAREEALQAALQVTMDYLSGVIDALRARVQVLDIERKQLNLALARKVEIKAERTTP